MVSAASALVVLAPALVTAVALAGSRWAAYGSPVRVRRWSGRAATVWAVLAAVSLVALLVGLRVQHADLAVWAAFITIAATMALVTAVVGRLASSFVRERRV